MQRARRYPQPVVSLGLTAIAASALIGCSAESTTSNPATSGDDLVEDAGDALDQIQRSQDQRTQQLSPDLTTGSGGAVDY